MVGFVYNFSRLFFQFVCCCRCINAMLTKGLQLFYFQCRKWSVFNLCAIKNHTTCYNLKLALAFDNIYTDQLLVGSNLFFSSNLIPLRNEAIVFSLPWEIPMISKCCTWTNVERCLLLISIPTYVPLLWLYVGLTVCSWWKMTLCSRLKICWQSLGHLQQNLNVWYWFHFFLMDWCFESLIRKRN